MGQLISGVRHFLVTLLVWWDACRDFGERSDSDHYRCSPVLANAGVVERESEERSRWIRLGGLDFSELLKFK